MTDILSTKAIAKLNADLEKRPWTLAEVALVLALFILVGIAAGVAVSF